MSQEDLETNPNYAYLQNTEFLEKLIDNTPKISTKINQTKLFNFMESSVLSLINIKSLNSNNENEEEQKLTNLDEYQIWAIIENASKSVFNDLNKFTKNENYTKDVIKELKTQNSLLGYELLKNKRKSSGEEASSQAESKATKASNKRVKKNKAKNTLKDLEDLYNNEEIEDEELAKELEANEESEKELNSKANKKGKKQTFVQDKFFDLEEFNNIGEDDMAELDLEEDQNAEGIEQESEGDLAAEQPEDEVKYTDFFDDKKLKSKKIGKNGQAENEEILDEDIEDNIFDLENKFMANDFKAIKDSYEFDPKQTASIAEIEQNMLGNKAWHMKGEVKAKERPKESLLENFLDFQVSIKPPPIPSADLTASIEKIVKLRIKEDLWDDPVRHKEINLNKKNKDETELDFEKSKKGLGEIYEDDYNKQIGNVSESEAKELYREIDDLTSKLYSIFDKLTNNSFVSGNRNKEMKIVTNVPAIQLEDISNFVTDNKANAQSANEIYSRKDMETKSKAEMTKEEKDKAHKHVKRNIRNRLREKAKDRKMKGLMNKLDSKFEAKFALKQMKDKNAKSNVKGSELKSSKFFGNLQNLAKEDKDKKEIKSKRREANAAASGELLSLGNGDAKKFKI